MTRLWLWLASVSWLCFATTGHAQKLDAFVKKLEAKIEPADPKPGQTVTIRITVELKDDWYTYPLSQADKGSRRLINKLVYPNADVLIVVGETLETGELKTKEDDERKYDIFPGGVVYTRKAVISPKAKAGETELKVMLKLTACNKDSCTMNDVPIALKCKVADGPAVAVEAKYKDEVEKAIGK